MIYVFDATRTLYARIAVEAEREEEAQKKFGIPSLQNEEYPWVEEEAIRLRTTYKTFEEAFDTDVKAEPRCLKNNSQVMFVEGYVTSVEEQ